MKKMYFKNKTVLIIGGTGSIGSNILNELIGHNPKEIRIYSRNEYKQYQLRYKYSNKGNVTFILGDVRDLASLVVASKNVDIIFHCAALKHVPFSEEMPEEFIKTNILGSLNVKKAAIENRVPRTISISTDKAVDSSNLMGLTKAIQEKIFSSYSIRGTDKSRVCFVNVRFGNVIGTHGSLFPIIHHQIVNKEQVTLTHEEMTRFFISSREAIDLILWAARNGKNGEIIVKKMKSVYIKKIIDAFVKVLGANRIRIKNIGIRAGEKIHESLITEDNLFRTKEIDGYYVITPYKTGSSIVLTRKKPSFSIEQFSSYSSSNLMTDRELTKYVQTYLKESGLRNTII